MEPALRQQARREEHGPKKANGQLEGGQEKPRTGLVVKGERNDGVGGVWILKNGGAPTRPWASSTVDRGRCEQVAPASEEDSMGTFLLRPLHVGRMGSGGGLFPQQRAKSLSVVRGLPRFRTHRTTKERQFVRIRASKEGLGPDGAHHRPLDHGTK